MFCGTSKAKVPNESGLNLIKKIGEVQNKKIKVHLDNGTLVYKNENGNWNYNFKNDLSQMTEEERNAYKADLEKKLQKKDEELNAIEKVYVAKLAKLCFMIQMHCDIKKQTTQEFKKHGIDTSERDEYEGDDNYY